MMKSSRFYASRREAESMADDIRAEIVQRSQTIGGAWDSYIVDRRSHGVREGSIKTLRKAADAILGPTWDEPLEVLTPRRAGQLYAAITKRYEPGTHQKYRGMVLAFTRWCFRKKWLKVEPFADVEPIGVRADHRGESLRRDEAREFRERCLELARGGDLGAASALVCLMTSLRPGEVVQIEARDVDDKGAVLWIDGANLKTRNTRRQIEIADPALRALLVQLAKGKAPDERLWPFRSNYPSRNAKRIAKLVKLDPEILNARLLRRTFASLSQRQAWSLDATAFAMGHGNDGNATTARTHYIAPGSVESGAAVSVARSLARPRDKPRRVR